MTGRNTAKSLSKKGHSESLLAQLNQFRINEQFTDVILICNERRFPIHRNILAAASPYFAAMFSGNFPESEQKEIHMHDMDSHCLQLALDFIYTAHLEICEEFVQELLSTATFLQLEHLTDICAQFMIDHLDADNCVGFRVFAEKQNNYLLLESAKQYIITHFKEVVKSEEFFEMSYDELAAILCKDELFVHSDDSILCGLHRWTNHRPDERVSKLASLLRFIHPACVSSDVALSLPLLQRDSDSGQWLRDVQQCEGQLEWHVFVLDKMGRVPDMHRFAMTFSESTPLKPVPRAAFALSVAAYKNILYVQGGSTGLSTHDSFYYNIYRDQWYDLTPLLLERSHHRSLVLDESLYAIGGNSRQGTTCAVECMNLVTNKAVLTEHLLIKRSSMGAAVCGGALYVMGGESDQRSLYSMERYDPRIGAWREMPPMHEINSYCNSAVIDDWYIYCCEGLGVCMERFDVRANKWAVINFWEEREFYEIFTVDNRLYSVSGAMIARFDEPTNKWETVYKFPETRDWDTAVGMRMMNNISA